MNYAHRSILPFFNYTKTGDLFHDLQVCTAGSNGRITLCVLGMWADDTCGYFII
jgi:hypothetical protein